MTHWCFWLALICCLALVPLGEMAGKTGADTRTKPEIYPRDHTPSFSASLNSDGSIKVSFLGSDFTIKSAFSYPNAGSPPPYTWNGFSSVPNSNPEATWKVTKDSANTNKVVGEGAYYRVEREISKQNNKIVVKDKITSKSSSQCLIVRFASQHKSKLHVDFCLSELSVGFSRRERVKPVEYSWPSMRFLSLKELGKGAPLPPVSRSSHFRAFALCQT